MARSCEDCGCPVERCDCAVGAIPLPEYRPGLDGLLIALAFTWSTTLTTVAMWVM